MMLYNTFRDTLRAEVSRLQGFYRLRSRSRGLSVTWLVRLPNETDKPCEQLRKSLKPCQGETPARRVVSRKGSFMHSKLK